MKNQKTMGNKGFSLVELIVVIAIMVVLVAVLAPVFTKYVEQSRRATDVQNASAIADAVLAQAAEDNLTSDTAEVDDGTLSAIPTAPTTRGNSVATGSKFTYVYDADANTCQVYVSADTGKTDITTETGAKKYRDDPTAKNNAVD